MKKDKIKKLIFTILLIAVLLIGFSIVVKASSGGGDGWQPDWTQFDNADGGKTDEVATNIVGALINIISIIGAGIAIVMLVILGIQYASANVTGKAEIKKSATKYVIGAVLIFAAVGILKIVQKFIEANINSI